MVEIVKCILKVVCCSHWMACFWCLQAHMNAGGPLGDLSSPNPIQSWLGEEGYCQIDPSDPVGYVCDQWGDIYTAVVYWSVMTITSTAMTLALSALPLSSLGAQPQARSDSFP